MKVVAFLQNQWFKDVERSKKLLGIYVKHEGGENEGRERFLRDMLFFGCLTGKRLKAAFGEEWCGYGGIIWEEASREMGDKPGAVFPADPEHMAEVVRRHQPDVVLLFGKVASAGWEEARKLLGKLAETPVLNGPHPAARHLTVVAELAAMKDCLEEMRKGTV